MSSRKVHGWVLINESGESPSEEARYFPQEVPASLATVFTGLGGCSCVPLFLEIEEAERQREKLHKHFPAGPRWEIIRVVAEEIGPG